MKAIRVGPYQEYLGQVFKMPSVAPVLLDENGEDLNEWWAPVEGYPCYEVSTRGRIASTYRGGKRKVLRFSKAKNGYLLVMLVNKGGKDRKRCYVHSVVARAFHGPRPEGYDIDHIDGNRSHNDAGNLQYISRSSNLSKGRACKVRVCQYTKDGTFVKEYESAKEGSFAVGAKGHTGNICKVLKGKIKSAYGYVWRYSDNQNK